MRIWTTTYGSREVERRVYVETRQNRAVCPVQMLDRYTVDVTPS